LKVIVDNYPEGKTEAIEVDVNPNDPAAGKTSVTFSRELYIEQDDFAMEPPKGFFRLCPQREVRLKGAYFLKFASVDYDDNGNISAVHCTYDPESRGGESPDGRKVKGTLHWVSADASADVTVNLYDRLFMVENPSNEVGVTDFTENLNPNSMVTLTDCKIDRSLLSTKAGTTFQFMRQGYFCVDANSTEERLIFNRTVALKDSWAKK
jgi:glutaminyl-tRNA synthetase